MRKKYTMNEAANVAKKAATDITNFLKTFEETIDVINVEDDEQYRTKDIDLLWIRNKNGVKKTTTIEIKGDRYHYTGNYFLETISNKSKGTSGCFMYTEADYIFYYFVDERELHVLPMPKTREWFINNMDNFKERETSTPIGNDYYITVGRLVNRNYLQRHVQGVKIKRI
ncbi:hypothetical protein ACRS52_02450 [Bacillus cytotoxicus]|uniref:Uncharacterized protein n=1 Tax=Bacillus cytotoxicus TaxID=580165 RepID=A0AAX2CDS5_9BACI|nr:hypothetical protein [Bacillus cytotoxicus]QTR83233.1 hypothetical protein JC777_01250 [Bacillus cytotoxicus]QTR86971.1 hypothetical protein JC774_21270 [Bacillus cytotoxicus]SCL85888.1 Uncharacterized protein BCB44BAC_00848 [Bacillus cytotoxicus]